MSYKPQDFLVGVIDFFAVLLPGAIFLSVGLGLDSLQSFLYSPTGLVKPVADGAPTWVAFVLAAYFVGHLLFLLGTFLDRALYDPLRAVCVPSKKDTVFQAADQARAKRLPPDVSINTFQWARASLTLHAPSALAQVERYEADSKFFRGVVVALHALFFLLANSNTARSMAAALPIGLLLLRIPHWRRSESPIYADPHKSMSLQDSGTAAKKDVEQEQRWNRVVVSFFFSVFFALLVFTVADCNGRGIFLWALLGLSIWRYSDSRWKSTRTAYQYAIILDRTDWKTPSK